MDLARMLLGGLFSPPMQEEGDLTRKPVLRTCVGCRRKEERGAFFRIGLDRDGTLGSWAGSGRSCYVHRTRSCMDAALRKGCLERALRRPVSPREREVLKEVLACQLR